MYTLFLDDIRDPTDNSYIICRSFEEAKNYVLDNGHPDHICFDHDLGAGPSGLDFAKWFCEYVMDFEVDLSDFSFSVHSQNPIGVTNISSYMNNFLAQYMTRYS